MLRVGLVVSLLISLVACSSTPAWKGVYSAGDKEKSATQLEVPPDLSSPSVRDRLALPAIASGSATYSAYQGTEYTGEKILPAQPKGVKLIRDGADQWLEIHSSPEKLWPQLKAFFVAVGFEIKREDKQLGVMETNWLENKPYVPSNWVSKLLNRVSSTGLKDKYRARLEKTANPDVTRVFITHQGLKEEAAEDINSIKIWWVRRDSDPELEAEMYERFLIFRNSSRAQAIKLVSSAKEKDRAKIIDKDGSKMLQVNEGFARTWRRVGIALDRIGLLVDDRNRSGGLYYLRITDDFRNQVKEEKGWLASLFSSDKVKLKDRYLLSVSDEKDKTLISIYETTGAKADSHFVDQLLNDLKKYLN